MQTTLFRAMMAAAGLFVLMGLMSCAPTEEKETLKLILARGGEGVQQAPEYVARAKGFFEQEGIEVEHLALLGPAAVAATLGGDADLFAGFSYVLRTHAQGEEELIAFSTVMNQFATSYIFSEDALTKTGITADMPWEEKFRRMKGIRLGVSAPGSSIDTLTRTLLTEQGLNPDTDITLTHYSGATAGTAMLAAIERGEVDAFAYAPPFPEDAEKRGYGKIVINLAAGEIPLTDGFLFVTYGTTKQNLAEKREAFVRFTRAMGRSLDYIKNNPEGTLEVLKSALPELDPGVIEIGFANMHSAFPDDPAIRQQNYDVNLKFQELRDGKTYGFVFDNLVDSSIVEEASK